MKPTAPRGRKSAGELAEELLGQAEEASCHLWSVSENQDEWESLFEKIAEANGEEPIDVGEYMDDLSLEVSVNAALGEYFQSL